jgi:alkanesulfonate monooxygenase SsuD/methylene tetrahydromethanopterin reductase-like flavin-dependent oxidoreductase (luciferase family)
VRFSVWPSAAQSWAEVLATAQHAESTGWDGVYVADHFMGDGNAFGADATPMLEATSMLAALAFATDRVRLGSLVFGITYRHPAVLANWAATTDHVSGGRLLLGIGAGWQVNEHEQYGIALGPPGERIDRFEEACAVLHGLLRTPATTVSGDHYELTAALCEPKPLQQPLPILIGGKGDRMMGVVARYADEWNMWSTAPSFAERSAALDRACERAGRDPGQIARSTQALWFLDDDVAKVDALIAKVAPRPAVGGPIDRLIDAVGAWHDAGVDEVIVPDFTLGRDAVKRDRMDMIIEGVAAGLR